MTRSIFPFFIAIWFIIPISLISQEGNYTLESIKSHPFPNETCVSSVGNHIAWAFNEEGKRNIYVASGPDFNARKLTNYNEDDGQELSSVSMSPDGQWIVYIRGGDFGSNWDDVKPVNPSFSPNPTKVEIWAVALSGGEPVSIGEGENPVISPDSKSIAFVKGGQIWLASIDGKQEAKKLFTARGQNGAHSWSSDGKLVFVSSRGGHSFIGVYRDEKTPIQWVSPSFKRDFSPRWSPDGTKICYIRRPGSGGKAEPILEARHNPWAIMTANINSGEERTIWIAPKTLAGSLPNTQGGTNLHWAKNRIVFMSYQDGWSHLYSINDNGGEQLLLTPGGFMAEYVSMSQDKTFMLFAGNTGPDPLDIEKRHVVKVSVDKADMEVLTPGSGLEWFPLATGDGSQVFFIGATAQKAPMPALFNLKSKQIKWIANDRMPGTFPEKKLVIPSQVIFSSIDGTPVHATLFDKDGGKVKKPAIIYVHGGPPRQMLLGWHYSSYYSNAYAMNQYLANLGFAVLSVNYRLGIGYGYEFHNPVDGGTRGASEYQDIKAAGQWLAGLSFIDPNKIGVYGGSYGGYLTAMALARDSDLFAAGVDIHGVHDRTSGRAEYLRNSDKYDLAPDSEKALEVAWKSSPVAYVDSWKSPVLIIHGDDDRNVAFSQSTDLVQRLEEKGIDIETLVIVDDTHHFMTHKNQMIVNKAVAEYFVRKFLK